MKPDENKDNVSVDKLVVELAAAHGRIQAMESELTVHRQKNEQQKIAINSLTSSNDSLAQCAEISKLGFAIWDVNLDRDTTVSEELAQIHGLTKEAYLEQVHSMEKYLEFVVPDDRQKYMDYENEADAGKLSSIEYRITRADGDVRYLMQSSALLRKNNQQKNKTIVVIQDITMLKEAENRLKTTQKSLEDREALLGQSADMVGLGYATWDNRNKKYLDVSERYANIFGYSKSAFLAKFNTIEKDYELVHPDDIDRYINYNPQIVNNDTVEYRIIRLDGETRHVQERSQYLSDNLAETSELLVTLQDITESKNINRQLIQASKLATLGEMATGVVHELNQPLNVIRIAAENSRRRLKDGDFEPEYYEKKLQRITDQTLRAAAIMNHLRVFGREANEPSELIDPSKALKSALDLVREDLRHSEVETTTTILKNCPLVHGHLIQLEQALLNIILNARDAMDDNGGKKHLDLHIEQKNNTALIIIEDTGGGIPEDKLARIFEPFFTTKEVGKGTGLGLSIAYGIIQGMGGSIAAENYSRVDESSKLKTPDGARFIIGLPLVT